MKIIAPWRISAILALVLFLLVPSAAFSDNVALNKTVTLDGTFFVGGWGGPPADPATVVDGTFLPEGREWDQGSVWWNGSSYPQNNIVINLGGSCTITGFKVQADDNDTYRVSYWNSGTNSFQPAYNVPTYGSWGLITRPQYDLSTPITTNLLKFEATGGDGYYAVSEIQAYGSQVPVPPTLPLLGSGLAGLALLRFRKKA
jgi:hypothetical protein